jgi:hypothetical protein
MTDLTWTCSSRCSGGDCVEAATDGAAVLLRDSKSPGPMLTFTRTEWAGFLDALRHDGYQPDAS